MFKFILIGLLLLQGSGAGPANGPQSGQQQTLAQISPAPIITSADHDDRAGSAWVISLVTVIALIIYTAFAGMQWLAIRRQATSAREQVGKMQGQLDEMKRQAGLMERGLAETEQLITHNENVVKAMQGQLDAIKRQEIVMEKQAQTMQETLAETRRIFDLTERPIIVVESAKIENLSPNQPLSTIITIMNKGRTPAQNISISLQIAAQAGFAYPFGFGDKWARPSYITLLAAGDRMLLEGAPADAVTIDDAFYDGAIKGREALMIHGRGSYEDLAGREYPIEEYAFHYYQKYNGSSLITVSLV